VIRSVRTEEHWLQQIRKLTELSRALTYASSLDEIFHLTVTRAADLLGATKSFLLVTKEDGLLSLGSSHGLDEPFGEDFHEPLTENLVPRMAARLHVPARDFAAVPLVVKGAIRGILVVIRPATSVGSEQDEWILSALADQAAAALEKTRVDEVAEFREQLIGMVSHDLRNPLSAILMAAHVLVHQEGLGESETELARRITRSATLASRLIDQLLDLTRSRLGGGIPIDPRSFDMNEILKQLIEETELMHPDRRVRTTRSGDLVGVWDRERLYHLLANLVGNAVQHGEPRSPIDLRVEGREDEVLLEVANRGEPIPPAAMPFIFEAFRKGRTDLPSKNQGPGLGLGLFIAQEIARAHGGTIQAVSSESDGTIFRVRLPRDARVGVPRV
jgi:signal transduction histidine kinase